MLIYTYPTTDRVVQFTFQFTVQFAVQFLSFLLFFVVFSLGTYDITEAEGVERGTKIIIHLKGDCYEYAKEEKIAG